MSELLLYLVRYMSFLYDEFGARFVDSMSRGAEGMLVLEVYSLRIRLVRERGQLFLDIQAASGEAGNEWFSIDVVMRLVDGVIVDDSTMDRSKVEFLHNNINEIVSAFAPGSRQATMQKLAEYERDRARRLFG